MDIMPLEPTETRTFEIREVGDLIRSPKGHTWIECETDAGTVAFWAGSRPSAPLRSLQKRTTPFKVRCGCRQPLPNYPTHAWWVPEGAPIEFLDDADADDETEDVEDAAPARKPMVISPPAASPFRAIANEQRTLYVVSATKATAWDDEPGAQPGVFVPALFAFRGRIVREWLASAQRAEAAHWLFLSPRYGFIEPDHPIANSDASFSDRTSGPISDDALQVQVEYQRRWNDRIALRDFQTVYVWPETAVYEDKARTAFELIGARVIRLKALTRAR